MKKPLQSESAILAIDSPRESAIGLEERVIDFDFAEYGASFSKSETYKVMRSFMLSIIDGPPVSIPVNSTVRLSPKTARTLFLAGKIEPVIMPTEFEVVHPVTSIDSRGEWVSPGVGDIVKMEKDEALKCWRSGHIKPKKED